MQHLRRTPAEPLIGDASSVALCAAGPSCALPALASTDAGTSFCGEGGARCSGSRFFGAGERPPDSDVFSLALPFTSDVIAPRLRLRCGIGVLETLPALELESELPCLRRGGLNLPVVALVGGRRADMAYTRYIAVASPRTRVAVAGDGKANSWLWKRLVSELQFWS